MSAALAATWVLTLVGLVGLVFVSFWERSFSPLELSAYLLLGGVSYAGAWRVGRALSDRADAAVAAFAADEGASLAVEPTVARLQGALLALLFPLYLYYLLLVVYLAFCLAAFASALLGAVGPPAARDPFMGAGLLVVALGLMLAALATAAAALVSLYRLLSPPRGRPAGISLTPEAQPALWALVREVAAAVGVPPVDRVVVSSRPEIAVYFDAGLLGALVGRGSRVLLLGVPALHDLTADELRAILAHEYGHFGNGHTRWGLLAHALGTALWRATELLPRPSAEQRQGNLLLSVARAFTVGYWVLFLYQLLYLRVTAGFFRLREVQADARAASLYGGPTLARALTKVVANDAIFRSVVELGIVPDLLAQGKVVSDLAGLMEVVARDMSAADREYWHTPGLADPGGLHPHDTHLGSAVRVAYAERYPPRPAGDPSPATRLFADWPALNARLAEAYNAALPTYA